MARPRKSASSARPKKQPCPRAHTHRPGSFCQTCNTMPTVKGE